MLRLRVTPKARADRIGRVGQDADGNAYLKVAFTQAPEKAKANAAVIKLLAKEWGVAKSDLRVVSGEIGRDKVLEARNRDAAWAAEMAARVRKMDF